MTRGILIVALHYDRRHKPVGKKSAEMAPNPDSPESYHRPKQAGIAEPQLDQDRTIGTTGGTDGTWKAGPQFSLVECIRQLLPDDHC